MRTDKAMKNSSAAIFQKILDTILAFVYRTVFIYIMGATYLGVNGLFSNIFSVMSLAELGVGSTIIYLLYEPLSKKKYSEVKSLMNLFSKMYIFIGCFIIFTGVILIPILPNLINNGGSKIPDLEIIYILMLLNTAVGYFFSYKRSLLEADQKGYYSSLNISFFGILNNMLKIFILIFTKNFILTLIVSLIITLISNISISIKANKIYPYLKKEQAKKLSKNKIRIIVKRMKAVFMHNISNIVLTGTDNIIISKFINIVSVGIYSNYVLITNTLYSIFTMIFVSITSSVGNMKIEDSKEKSEKIFYRLLLANFYIYFVSCIVLWCCITPFIKLWIGNTYLLGTLTTFIIILNLYISGMRHVVVTFINASGLNYNTRYKSIVEAVLNIVISLIGVKYFGIFGVVLGTVVSLLSCSAIVEPIVLFKHWFKKTSKDYFKKYLFYLFITLIIGGILGLICFLIPFNDFIGLVIRFIMSFTISNLIFILIYYKNEDFKFYLSYFKKVSMRILKKGN